MRSAEVLKARAGQRIWNIKRQENTFFSTWFAFSFLWNLRSFSWKNVPLVLVGKSPGKQPSAAYNDDENVQEEESTAYLAPVIKLPDRVEVKIGKEVEEVLYSHRAKDDEDHYEPTNEAQGNLKFWKETKHKYHIYLDDIFSIVNFGYSIIYRAIKWNSEASTIHTVTTIDKKILAL